MNNNLLIAIIVTVLMVGAHIGVFWWFVCRAGQLKATPATPEDAAKPAAEPAEKG